jgi:hypothetical protein
MTIEAKKLLNDEIKTKLSAIYHVEDEDEEETGC